MPVLPTQPTIHSSASAGVSPARSRAAFAAVAFFDVSVLLVIACCAAVGLAATLLAARKEGAA